MTIIFTFSLNMAFSQARRIGLKNIINEVWEGSVK